MRLLRVHSVLHLWAGQHGSGRVDALLHPVVRAVFFHPVPLGEIQHRCVVPALGI